MEYDKQLEALMSQALREVERDLSLPNNSLVDETPLPKISREVRLKSMVVQLDRNFLARVPENVIQYSKELQLCKRVMERGETMSVLMKTLEVLLEQ